VSDGWVDDVLPETVNGLPLHVLSVHATVVMVPLLALVGLLFAVPRFRAWARWPLGLLAVAAAGSTFVSMNSGGAMEEYLERINALSGPFAAAVERHEELAEQLQWMVYGYAVICVVAAVVVGSRAVSASRADRGTRADQDSESSGSGGGAVAIAMSVLLVLGAVAIGVQVARVGDAGAKAVWNPDGSLDYSSGED